MAEVPSIITLTMNPALDIATSVPRIRPTKKLRCAAPSYDPGGGGINVARAIVALGGQAVAVFPSGGSAGAEIERMLEAEQVPFEAVAIKCATRESLSVDEAVTGRQYRFMLPGPPMSSSDQSRCLQALRDLPQKPLWLVASGSLPPGVPDGFFANVGQLCRSLGIRLVLDTSGPALAACEGLQVAMIKPSLLELAQVTGKSLDGEAATAAAARNLVRRRFADAIVVSMGARGALLVTAEIEHAFEAISVPVRSTVGAGDSMLAGITLSLARNVPLLEAVAYGVVAGAAAVMAPGTSLAKLADVIRLHGRSATKSR